MTVNEQTAEAGAGAQPDGAAAPAKRKINWGMDRFSGLYVWAGLILIFALWVPDLFLTASNARIVAGSEAITAIVALGLIVPVAAGAFDLSIAGTVGVSVCTVMWMQSNGYSWIVGIVLALLIGVIVGLLNSFIVVKLHVDSFIGTLGMSSILVAVAYWITGGTQIVTGISPDFLVIGQKIVFGLPLPVFYMIGLAIVLWWLLEYTPIGRYLYAVGGNPQAAKLAGVRVDRITTGAFMLSRSHRRLRRHRARREARLGQPRRRHLLPAAGVLGRLPRRHPDPARPGQRHGHAHRDLPAGDRRQGPPAGRDAELRQGPVQRTRADHRGRTRRPDGSTQGLIDLRRPSPVPPPEVPGGGDRGAVKGFTFYS